LRNRHELERLTAEWYARLKSEGFKDIERPEVKDRYSHRAIRDPRGATLSRVDPLEMELGQHYYRLAARFLHEHTFKSERHYDAWDAFSQGMTYRQIGMQIGCSHVMAYKIVSQLLAGPFDRYLKAALSSDPDELEIPPKGRGAA
jgi:hypothetical protein